MAQLFYKLNHQYVIDDGKIQFVDKLTGRIMPVRSWEQGLHQMIESKEGCEISDQRKPQARISYQRFFSQYLMLGGPPSGTVKEVAAELRRVYGLNMFKVATNKQQKRKMLGEKVYQNLAIKKQVLIARVQELLQQNRAILVGTSSIEESEQISLLFAIESNQSKARRLLTKQDRKLKKTLRVDCIAPTEYFGLIQKGMEVKVLTEKPIDQTFQAKVSMVEQLIVPASGSFSVHMTVPIPDDKLVRGANSLAVVGFSAPLPSDQNLENSINAFQPSVGKRKVFNILRQVNNNEKKV
jgi:hypothetical protein